MTGLRLRAAPKVRGAGPHRTVGAAETLRRLRPLLRTVGVTRLADVTGLDRVGIPTYAAIVPDSPDVLSVYNGKGPTKLDAKVGAAMEAVERYSALSLERPLVTGTYRALARRKPVLDPAELVIPLHPDFGPGSSFACVQGYDLLGHRPVLVPAQAVAITFERRFGDPCYTFSTTNGLASGNTPEEAVCHALCEVIERDAWTLAELRARFLPEMLRRHGRWRPHPGLGERDDDIEVFPSIDVRHAPPPVGRLCGRFARAGLTVRLKDVTSDLGVTTVLATVAEEVGIDFAMAHFGLGTHPDATVALTRAITEVAQSRVADIQGVREDLGAADATDHPFPSHTRRVRRIRRTSWYHRDSARTVSWRSLPHHEHADVLTDIDLLLARLRAAGIEQVIAVDLTRQAVGVPVLRVLVPGMESWAADDGRLGWRAERYWKDSQLDVRSRVR